MRSSGDGVRNFLRGRNTGTQKSQAAKPVALGKIIAVLILTIFAFTFGVGVGNGRIGLSSGTNTNLPNSLDYATVNQVYQALKTNYDGKLDANKLLDGAKSGLTSATGDPYTEYFSAANAKSFNDDLNGTFTGIGAEVGQDAHGVLQIVAPIDGFPAAKAGLRASDLILEINGANTTDMTVDAAVNRIRGPKGSNVTLKILRGAQNLSFTIIRDDIKVPSVKSETLDGNIGYIKISQFSDDTSELAQQAAKQFRQAGVKGIILDLRDDPGGLLNAAVDVSSLWVPEGKTILQEKRDNVVIQTHMATGNDILHDIPTVVLVNNGSASASEITAGALHDNNVATIMGEKSYGKGSVQTIIKLPGGSEMKITVARWYRPNGQNIDKKGISPDKAVKMTEDDYKNKLDPQKDAALAQLRNE